MGALQDVQGEISDAEESNFPGVLAPRECVHGVFNRDCWIGPMDLIKRNGVELQSPETSLESRQHTLTAQIAAHLPRSIPDEATFGGDYHVASLFAQSASQQLLGPPETVDISDVEESDASFDGDANRRAPFVFVHWTVVVSAGRSAAEADARYRK